MTNGRPRSITIYLDKKKYFLKYYDVDGVRRNKSTKSSDISEANLLKKEIELLQINPESPVSTFAQKLYFGSSKTFPTIDPIANEDLFQIIAELQTKVKRQEQELKRLYGIEEKYTALVNSVEGRLAEGTQNAPTLSKALDKYLLNINHLSRYKRNYYNFIHKFFEDKIGLGQKIYEVKAIEVYNYLEKDSLANDDPEARWNRQRQQFTKFFNWACSLWVFHNPMDQVPTKKEGENKDPHFHDIKEVNKIIDNQPDEYHKAMLAVLFFSGVSAHEFRGLKKDDYFKINKEWYLRVSPNEERNIKAAKRRRNIPVGKKLKKHLDNYLEVYSGKIALFPAIKKTGDRDFWHDDTLSRYLNDNVFNEDMDCKSTRRTYGSLQLRDGKTFAEVAGLMGNSIMMVERHYARYKSSEVKSNL